MAVQRFVEDIPVHDGDYVYLSDWCNQFGYRDRDEFYHDAVCDDKTETEIEEEWQEVVDQFYEWCELHRLIGQEV